MKGVWRIDENRDFALMKTTLRVHMRHILEVFECIVSMQTESSLPSMPSSATEISLPCYVAGEQPDRPRSFGPMESLWRLGGGLWTGDQ